MADDDKRDDPSPTGMSRRAFLRGGAAVGALGTATMLVGEIAEGAAKKPATPAVTEGLEVFGPGPVPIRLKVNDTPYDLKLEPRTTLLDALREELEFTGAKRVCDRGTCGACTVILNGKAVYACSLLAIDVQRQPIETIEGLAKPGRLHPLSAAFVENDAQLCGFCTPGFVMAAKALLDHTPTPNLKDVHHGLSGNFCRCGAYPGLRQAVIAAAPHMDDDNLDIGSDDRPVFPAPEAPPKPEPKAKPEPKPEPKEKPPHG